MKIGFFIFGILIWVSVPVLIITKLILNIKKKKESQRIREEAARMEAEELQRRMDEANRENFIEADRTISIVKEETRNQKKTSRYEFIGNEAKNKSK